MKGQLWVIEQIRPPLGMLIIHVDLQFVNVFTKQLLIILFKELWFNQFRCSIW